MHHLRSTGIAGILLIAGVFAGLFPVVAEAQSDPEATRVVVRAVSQDAKVIQDPVGGARVTIREVETGRVLARGLQKGDSGSTEKIMRQPHERGTSIYGGAAKYVAQLRLARPTVVEVAAEGPMAYPQAIQRTSKTMLLVPGEHVEGDGVVLTLHGYIVEIERPAEPLQASAGSTIDVRARVRMMCGCPTEPGGMWDADEIDIEARLLKNGSVVKRTPLRFAGETSIYEGTLEAPQTGRYRLQVIASDPEKVNFGRHERAVRIR